MKKCMKAVVSVGLSLAVTMVHAHTTSTNRITQFSNDQVKVWKTIIYPSSKHGLRMHRHDHNRVVVALSSGVLKITNDKGKVHYLRLEKDKAYYLSKDVPNELHADENITHKPIKVMVVELLDGATQPKK